MRHFGYLGASDADALFETPPEPFRRDSGPELLSVALGATLYMPADRPSLANDITKQSAAGVTSVVVCLEDSIADEQVDAAEANLVQALDELHRAHPRSASAPLGAHPRSASAPLGAHPRSASAPLGDPQAELPLLFVRVREPRQMPALVARLGEAVAVLDGFVLPKFTATSGTDYLHALDDADRLADHSRGGHRLMAMPVIESGAALYAETRVDELTRLHALLHRDRRRILAVRLGATDLCALYGIRRSPELTIYDVKVVSSLIADVVNVLGRTDGTGFTVTGPVWEYYAAAERIFKPQLRRSPFEEQDEGDLRGRLVSRAIDGLIREVQMDKANGLHGKTAIHPSHVAVVNSMSVVSAEEFRDATAVLHAGRASGVLASGHGNKMNEIRPHTAWARVTTLRARVFGVAADGVSFVDLLAASLPR